MPNEEELKESEGKTPDEETKEAKAKSAGEGEEGEEKTGKEDEITPQVKKLRKENANKRIEIKQLRDKLAEAEVVKTKADAKDGDKGVKPDPQSEILKVINKRYIRSELKAAALKAGLVDVDALKMFDTSSLEVDDSGDIVGISDLIEEMKEAKDYLFNQKARNTTSSKKTPGETPPNSKSALDMSDDEYAKEARKLGLHVEDSY